ncbi:AgmX/PglI C-terminal domain-containing protein [Peredibacter sp. HCB2-198]|uniref:AgmX/PglI C-terminal domain-containing protein n=1 Tax=Peredibacter sp. HCB2-198 TaxID=3383025 RepID=UPI0038B521DB
MELEKNKGPKMFEVRTTRPGHKTKGGVFGKGRFLLGRSESCDLIVNNDAISAVHAVLEVFDDKAIIYDMNSTNGTYVNDAKVIVKEFRVGDTFRLADVEFSYQVYVPEEALPPVLETLEPIHGEASVKLPPELPAAPRSLPKAAPTVSSRVPSIVYPLAADPKAEFSEYIFEDKDDLYPIFKYEAAKQAVEVIILHNDQVFSVDYFPEGRGTYFITGIMTKKDEIEFPYLNKNEKFPFVDVRGGSATVHTLPGFGVFLLSDKKKDTGHVGTSIELSGQDLVRLQKDHLQIFVRNVAAPPKIAAAPILKRDPEFRKYLAMFMLLVGLFFVSLNVIEVPEDEKKDELAPERLATILYKQPLTVSKNVAVEKTEKAPKVAQQSPHKVAVEKTSTTEKKPDVKKPDVITTKEQNKKPDPGKKTATEKKVVKQGTTPVTKPSNKKFDSPIAKSNSTSSGAKAPTAYSQYEAKTAGHVEVYKSADFSSSVSTLVAKGGSLSGVKTVGASGSGSGTGQIGAATGVVGGTGSVKTSNMVTNQGSLVGATTGVLGESKGAEGLSAKREIYTAGIPGETVVLGSMDPDVIRRILIEHLPQFRYCYQQEIERRGSEVFGVVKLNFVIGASGHVSKAGTDGSSGLPADVSKCVVNVLRGITFPEPLGGGTVEVKQPMNFQTKKM